MRNFAQSGHPGYLHQSSSQGKYTFGFCHWCVEASQKESRHVWHWLLPLVCCHTDTQTHRHAHTQTNTHSYTHTHTHTHTHTPHTDTQIHTHQVHLRGYCHCVFASDYDSFYANVNRALIRHIWGCKKQVGRVFTSQGWKIEYGIKGPLK